MHLRAFPFAKIIISNLLSAKTHTHTHTCTQTQKHKLNMFQVVIL